MRKVIFVAPENCEKFWNRVASHLEEIIDPTFKNMEFGRAIENKLQWSLQMESDTLLEVAKNQHEGVDIVAFSGGAAASLAFMADHPELVRSATLVEPPWFGNDWWSKEEVQYAQNFDQIIDLPIQDIFNAFVHFYAPNTPAPMPTEMTGKTIPKQLETNGKGVRTAWEGYRSTPLDRAALKRISGPVYLPIGGESIARMQQSANFMATYFERSHIEVYASWHHFELVIKEHQALADNIRAMWKNTVS